MRTIEDWRAGAAVSASLRVMADDLRLSAATMELHADGMRARHAAADRTIESSQRGLPVGAADALGSAVAKWQADTSTLYGQLVGHGHAMRSGAAAYHAADERGATALDAARDLGP